MIPASGIATFEMFRERRRAGDTYTSSAPVVGFDHDGETLVLRYARAERLGDIRGVAEVTDVAVHQPVPAQPGWYALVVYHYEREPSERVVMPVVAWLGSEYGDAIVVPGDPEEYFGAVTFLSKVQEGWTGRETIGVFHDEFKPLPPDEELAAVIDSGRAGYVACRAAEREQLKAETGDVTP